MWQGFGALQTIFGVRVSIVDMTIPESDLLPLKPVEALVLTMLAAGDRHGYGIRQDIIEHTQGAIKLEAGNLYRTIRQLERNGLVGESTHAPATTDERRRYYQLTPFGKRVLAAEMIRLRDLLRLAEAHRVIAPLAAGV